MTDYMKDIVNLEVKACATRNNLNSDDVLSIFLKLDAAKWYEPKFPQATAFDLALKYLDAKKATWLFLNSDIGVLRKKVSICEYLNDPLTPFCNITELSGLLDSYSGYLLDNKDCLLKTGYPKKPFHNSPWLESKLGGLLCTKIPLYHPCDIFRKGVIDMTPVVSLHEDSNYTSLKKDVQGNWIYSYIWDRHPELSVTKHDAIEGHGFIFRYMSSNDGCDNYSEAGLLPFISEEVVMAEKCRSQLFNLKLNTIQLLCNTLKKGDVWGLWNEWLSIAGDLCDPETIKFLRKIDNLYDENNNGSFGINCCNSGLLGILYIMAHCEKELKYGSLRRTKDAFLNLPGGLFRGPELNYYEFIGEEYQSSADNALDRFFLWEEDEKEYWKEVDHRINESLTKLCNGTSPVYLEEWVDSKHKSLFVRNIKSYAQWQKVNMETTGQLAPLTVTAEQSRQSAENKIVKKENIKLTNMIMSDMDEDDNYEPEYGWKQGITPAEILEELPVIFEGISFELGTLTKMKIDGLTKEPQNNATCFDKDLYKQIDKDDIDVMEMIRHFHEYHVPCKIEKIHELFDGKDIACVIFEAFSVIEFICKAGEPFLTEVDEKFPHRDRYPQENTAKEHDLKGILRLFCKFRETIESFDAEKKLKDLAWKLRAYKRILTDTASSKTIESQVVNMSTLPITSERHDKNSKQTADFIRQKNNRSNNSVIPKKLTPLSPNARTIHDKLCSLKHTEAMTLPAIQDWWYEKTKKNLDEGTFKKYRKELLPYGLKNKPRIGYYIQK